MTRSAVRRRLQRLLAGTGIAIASLDGASSARAQSPVKSCVGAYDAEQRLVDAGDLVGAREKLYECGATDCPSALQRECIDSIAALEPRIPTVVLAARDAGGHDLAEVHVSLDGAAWRDRLDGREVPVNPGPHRLRFTASGLPAVEVDIVARERDKGRLVQATFGTAGQSGTTPPPVQPGARGSGGGHGIPATSWALGGVAVVGLATYAYFLASALSERNQVSACSPSCGESLRDDVNHKLLAADVSWITAVVAAGGATLVFLLTRATPSPATAWATNGPGLFAW